MPQQSANFSGAIPQNYDRYLGPMLFEPYAIDLVSRIDVAGINAILEIACGTGRVTKHLRRTFPAPIRLVATDINPGMLEIGMNTLTDATIEWKVADAQNLPFEDNSFDVVVCQFGLMFMPDKAKAMSEAYRVLKPGGQFLTNTWNNIEVNGILNISNEVMKSYFPEDPPKFFFVPCSMHDENELRSLIDAAGFTNEQIVLVKKDGVSRSAAEAAIGAIEGSPVSLAILEKDASLLHRVREAIQNELASKYGNAPMISPLQAWVITAKKKA